MKQVPQPPIPWTNTLDTLESGSECIQKSLLFGNKILGSEDCLYLNVFVPGTYIEEKNIFKPKVLFKLLELVRNWESKNILFFRGSVQISGYCPVFFSKCI